MKNKLFTTYIFTLLIFSCLTIESCRSEDTTSSCFPHVNINAIINLNLPAYYNLQNPNGWVYINEQSSGTRGLIVVRTSNGFKIYDRNPPHICPDSNTTLIVENHIKIVCPKDKAEWILLTGEPIAVSNIAPKTYSYTINNNILTIYN